MTNASILSILAHATPTVPHQLQGQKVKSQSHGAGHIVAATLPHSLLYICRYVCVRVFLVVGQTAGPICTKLGTLIRIDPGRREDGGAGIRDSKRSCHCLLVPNRRLPGHPGSPLAIV